jgi:hypothetical protein
MYQRDGAMQVGNNQGKIDKINRKLFWNFFFYF